MARKFIALLFMMIMMMMGMITSGMAQYANQDETFDFKCWPKNTTLRVRFASPTRGPIVIQLSNHVLNQVVSRIFAIYLKEMLGYKNDIVFRVPIYPLGTSEESKITRTIDDIDLPDVPVINLGVWMPSDHHSHTPKVTMAGPFTMGRFGWFIPKDLITDGDLPDMYPYKIFQTSNSDILRQFIMDDDTINLLAKLADHNCQQCEKGVYIPEHCKHTDCATLLAPKYRDTSFVIHHIDELKMYVKVLWLGDNLRSVINYLYNREMDRSEQLRRKFIVLHWSPSVIIDTAIEFKSLTMPRCEDMYSSNVTKCKYELTPLLKYFSDGVKYSNAIYYSTLGVYFNANHIQNIFNTYYNRTEERVTSIQQIINNNYLNLKHNGDSSIYNDIACEWISQNLDVVKEWEFNQNDDEILIGGIFPISEKRDTYSGVIPAVRMAQSAINNNRNVLPDYRLSIFEMDGQCRPDSVMKAFINYYMKPARVLGVLGPACSETLEPIAGISKHVKISIISYSAEGASFLDRQTYPYFFRTIGENRQYEHVYVRLLKELNWARVAALTEDGQKYTEYISHMETTLKLNGMELISNKKFHRYITPEEMNRNLIDLQRKNAYIIIADINDEVAHIVMCEAYKLKMTPQNGYVWFLPIWLSKNWINIIKTGRNISCTIDQLMDVVNGHFSLSHAPFGDDNLMMQENKTIGEWRKEYKYNSFNDSETGESIQSVYAGFAYDAMWVYAFALDRMIKEDPSYLSDLHSDRTTKKLIELIGATDFDGVSGRIRFGEGGTRFSVINVLQWVRGQTKVVGSFYPNISESVISENRKLIGGNLVLNKTLIEWYYPKGIPTDGTVKCSLETMAKLLDIECSLAVTVLTTIICLTFVIIVSIASFMFWKQRYDRKLKQSAKLMRSFGIDLKSPTSILNNTLDKWEIPKDRVVINRRLGEGDFGTVYGGEAQINDDAWTAVAVKTLKIGSGTEVRLDFLSEAEAMKRFDHRNIVQLLGVCLQTEPIYLIMEFMLYGDLKTFLLARRHLVGEKVTDESDISPKRLTIMALDVARGLSYLAENKYVHRDVACRNCLVNAQRVIKLGDFGMCRPMFENDYYRFNRKGMLPVRWMAPESLGLGIFTPASDVWSFGVLLYEIITFGSFPFQGMTNNQVLEYVKQGNTLTIPNGVKPHLEGLMKACWNPQYKKRPTASEICDFISNYPRLVIPCLDVPLASVQMPEFESDQLDLLPGLRKRTTTNPTTPTTTTPPAESNRSEVGKSSISNNLDETCCSSYPNGITLTDFNLLPDIETATASYDGPSNAYNPVEPLLHRDEEMSSSSLSLRRYVPMYGFKKSNRSLTTDSATNNSSIL